jgi:hypothetical protein
MNKLIAAAFGLVLLAAPAAFAKGGSPQTHHCKMADGTMDMAKTKKECKAAKGTWAKDEAAKEAEKPAAPAPAK